MIEFITEHWLAIFAGLVTYTVAILFIARFAGFNQLGHDEE